jgi:3-hydroxyisobutyrate dehydrogenase-like beta-hydroxyacid dehydrogenase
MDGAKHREQAVAEHTNPAPVTVIGLGLMGSALARAFLRNGHPTTVWNRSAAKADGLITEGAIRAATVGEAVSASPVVVVCALDHAAVRRVLDLAGDSLAGRVLVDLTSGTPTDARDTAMLAVQRGAVHLDGAIMAVPPAIGGPEAMVLYSGSQAAFEAHQPTLTHLGASTYLGADPGLAALYDLALLGVMWSALAGFYHAVALVGTEQIEATAFAPLAVQWLDGVAASLPEEAREIDEGQFVTEVSTLAINAAAITHLVDASRTQGIGVDVPGPIKALIDRRVADGNGSRSLASLVELIRQPPI